MSSIDRNRQLLLFLLLIMLIVDLHLLEIFQYFIQFPMAFRHICILFWYIIIVQTITILPGGGGGGGGQPMRQQYPTQQVSRTGYQTAPQQHPTRTIYSSGNYQTVRTQPAQQVIRAHPTQQVLRTQYQPLTPLRGGRSSSPDIEIIEEVRTTPVSSRVGRPVTTPVARPAPTRRARIITKVGNCSFRKAIPILE